MGSDYREIRPQGSPHIPQSTGFGYFAEQARFAGYMGPDLGRTQHQHFRGDHHQQSPHPYPLPHAYAHPHPHHHPLSLPHSHDMHEVIQREIEKERIRQEIIMSEIVRRRELEAEVRRELMMERELAPRSGNNGYSFGSPSVMGFDSPMRLQLVETRAEGRSLEERLILSLADRDRLSVRHESVGFEPLLFQRGSVDMRISEGAFEPLPFQRASADVRVSEVKPVSEGSKEKEKIILLAKPNENISGVKREASGLDASEFPSDGNAKKKTKEEWSCALCQVSATSERGLNEHLKGKKHKSKEAALRAQKAGKNYSIGLLPKKTAKAAQVPGTVDPATDSEVKLTSGSLPFNKTGEVSSKLDEPPVLLENLDSDNLKKNEGPIVPQKLQKSNNPKKNKYRFWCELCQVGVGSQRVMNKHLSGKRHKRRLQRSSKNCGVGTSSKMDGSSEEPVEESIAEDGGSVDEPLDETLLEDVEATDVIKPDDDLTKTEVADEPKDNDGGAGDIIKPDNDLTGADVADEGQDDDGEAVDVIKPHDDLTKGDLS